jgi:hypothetical protein
MSRGARRSLRHHGTGHVVAHPISAKIGRHVPIRRHATGMLRAILVRGRSCTTCFRRTLPTVSVHLPYSLCVFVPCAESSVVNSPSRRERNSFTGMETRKSGGDRETRGNSSVPYGRLNGWRRLSCALNALAGASGRRNDWAARRPRNGPRPDAPDVSGR